jgi:autophagy-related protein 27
MPRLRPCLYFLFFSLVRPALASFDCKFDITTHHFDLTSLKGVHTTYKSDDTPPTITNTTFFIDLCQDLQWDKDVFPPSDRCEDGTQGTRFTAPG